MRKMATIRKIDDIQPIANADAIEVASVGGWRVVVKKSEFKVGDLAVYCEIDSWIPHELAPFLSKGSEPREYNGVKGERLRTIKLRGQVSQGLLLPLEPTCANIESRLFEGLDVSVPLDIQKWEMPVPVHLAGQVKGNFPTQIPKTDQERVQNLAAEILEHSVDAGSGTKFEITEKLEGSSVTFYLLNGEFGVCSRNFDLIRDDNNAYWRVAIEQDVEAIMREFGDDYAIQAELVGPGIQKNIYGLSALDFYVYDLYDVDCADYVRPDRRRNIVASMGFKHVPVIAVDKDLGVGSVADILGWADDESQLKAGVLREGIVFKQADGEFTFKAVSNKYLLKHGE